jgi:hypothetical protein
VHVTEDIVVVVGVVVVVVIVVEIIPDTKPDCEILLAVKGKAFFKKHTLADESQLQATQNLVLEQLLQHS